MGSIDSEANITASLRNLYKSMSETSDAFPPYAFLTVSASNYVGSHRRLHLISREYRFSGKWLLNLRNRCKVAMVSRSRMLKKPGQGS